MYGIYLDFYFVDLSEKDFKKSSNTTVFGIVGCMWTHIHSTPDTVVSRIVYKSCPCSILFCYFGICFVFSNASNCKERVMRHGLVGGTS